VSSILPGSTRLAARGLRWRDVDSDEVNIILHVKGKTGSREVVARTSEVQTYFQRIWDLRCEERGGLVGVTAIATASRS
jgi:hypothetical protein